MTSYRMGAFTAFLYTRWNRMRWLGRIVTIVLVLVIGAGLGSFSGPNGIRYGLFIAAVTLAFVSALFWWREPGKTLLAQLFLTPVTLYAAQQQLPIVAPSTPLPAITATPIVLWIIVASLVVHRVAVPRQWLRSVIVVETAAYGGWLLGEWIGPLGIGVAYIISALMLYALTWGWFPITNRLRRRSASRMRYAERISRTARHIVDPTSLQQGLGGAYTVTVDVLVPSRGHDSVIPLVATGPNGVFAIDKRQFSGVVREDSQGLTIGGKPATEELAAYASTCDKLSRTIGIPLSLMRPVLVIEKAAMRNGRAQVAIFDGDAHLFDVTLLREDLLAKEIQSFQKGSMSRRLSTRSAKRLARLTPAGTTLTPTMEPVSTHVA